MELKMTEKEIEKYRRWYVIEETTERLMNRIKEVNAGTEIKGIDDFKKLLDESIKYLAQKIEELSDKNEANIIYQMIYNTVFNKFLVLIFFELNRMTASLEVKQFPFPTYIHYEGNNNFRLDNHMITYWLKGELALPYLFTGFTKSINTKWLDAWRSNVMKVGISDSMNKEMLKLLEPSEDPEKKELISKLKICRDLLRDRNDKRPYALTRICKIMNERYSPPIAYNTLRDKMHNHNIPTDIKRFTELYG